MIGSIWSRCSVAGVGGLCGKPVRVPVVGVLGFCEEHSAKGENCRCGKFWIASDRDAIVGLYGYHSPVRCSPRRRGGKA